MKYNNIRIYSIVLLGIVLPTALSATKIPFHNVEKIQAPQETLFANFILNLDELYLQGEHSGIPRNTLLKIHYEYLTRLLFVNEKSFTTLFQGLKNETLRYFCRYLFYTKKKQFLDTFKTPKTWNAIYETTNLNIDLTSLAHEHINLYLSHILDLITIIAPDLQFLWLSRNELKQIPPQIGNLKKLKWLDASDNKLTTLPEELGDCLSLQVLWLENNELTDLPSSIQRLKNLNDVDLQDNKLIPSLMHNFKSRLLIS